MNETAVRLTISGRVQGVGFRAFVADEARSRSLRGWVRNRRDGAVEALIGGAPGAAEEMIAACKRGPPGARVSSVDVRPADETELTVLRIFEILPAV